MDYAKPITAGDLTRYHASNLKAKAERLNRTIEGITAERDALRRYHCRRVVPPRMGGRHRSLPVDTGPSGRRRIPVPSLL